MVPQDTPGSLSDVPKRSKRFFRHIGKKKFIYIVLPLLLINAGVARLLMNQVALRAGAQNVVKDEIAVLPQANEVSTAQVQEESIEDDDIPVITTYKVQKGDTLSGIAEKFNITLNTIRWANDLTEKTSKIAIGDELIILPVSGVEHTVKKGETLSGIAAKYDANQEDILKYNDIEKDAIKVGTTLIIPGAEPIVVKTSPKKAPVVSKSSTTTTKTSTTTSTQKETTGDSSSTSKSSGYANPISGGILTQGIHDGNAVDFGVPVGTPVKSFKDGTVLVAKGSGYNGGYGNFVVINHSGACQTQYSHLSTISVSVGDTVKAGEVIAKSGNTGRSTGPHLHFNVRNCGGNPFTKFKVGTRF